MPYYMIGPGAVAVFGTANPVLVISSGIVAIVATLIGSAIPSNNYYGYGNYGQNPGAYDGISNTGIRRFGSDAKIVQFKTGNKCKAFGIPKVSCSDINPQLGAYGIYAVTRSGGITISPIVDIKCSDTRQQAITKVKNAIQAQSKWNSYNYFSCNGRGKTIGDLTEHIWS